MNGNYQFAKKIRKEVNEKDKANMPLIYEKCSDDERTFIDVFMKKFLKYKKGIIYNEKSGCLNFCYNDMQIGRIRLKNKKRMMQILTRNNVEWIENISLEEAIHNIDNWYNYLNEILEGLKKV